MNVEYNNQISKVRVGKLYESVTVNGETIEVGDIVGFEVKDPNPNGVHEEDNEAILSQIVTGKVGKIYQTQSGPEIGIKGSPVGRISVEDIDTQPDRVNRYFSEFPEANGNCVVETWYSETPWSDEDYQVENEYTLESY